MCLEVKKPEIIVAQEDIICYKVLIKRDNSVVSPYWAFEYKIGETYKIEKPLEIKKRINYVRCCNEFEVRQGFHSFEQFQTAKAFLLYIQRPFRSGYCAYKCIIPKGTKMVYGYFSGRPSIASETIKIIEEI